MVTRALGIRGWALALALIPIAVFFYWPVASILSLGLSGSDPVSFTIEAVLEVVWFTLWQAVISAAGSVAAGLVFAYLLFRMSGPGWRFWQAAVLVPFALPVIVLAIGMHTFQIGNVIPGVFWVLATHMLINASVTTRLVGSALQQLDADCDAAAELDGAGRFRTFWAITLPQLGGTIRAAALLSFAFCAASFSVILLLADPGTDTIETLIYRVTTGYLDLRGAALLAILQLVLMAIAFGLGGGARQLSLGLAPQSAARRVDRRDLPLVLLAILLALLAVAPFANLLVQSLWDGSGWSLQNFANLSGLGERELLNLSVWDALANSTRNAALVGLAATLLGTLMGYLSARSRSHRLGNILNLAYTLPLGVSTVVLGFGYLISFDSPPLELRSSWLIIPIAQTLLALPLAVNLMTNAFAGVDHELLDAALSDGASTWQRLRLVELPLVRQAIGTAAAFSAVVALGDFGASSFLAYGDQETLPQVLYRLIARPGPTNFGMAMAASVVLMTLITALVALTGLRKPVRKKDLGF